MIILLKISTQEGATLLLTFCLWLLKENMGIAASKAAVSSISIASRAGRWNRLHYGPPPTSRAGHPFLKRRQNKIKRQQQILESHKARAGELLLAGWRVRLSACTAPGVGDHVRLLSGERGRERWLWNTETEYSLKFRLGNLRQSWPLIVWKVGDFASVDLANFFWLIGENEIPM